MKKDLRGGENWNYGAGSVRAMVTPEYKTINQIRADKNKLVSTEEMEKVKEEMNNNLLSLASKIADKNYGNQFIANDIATEFIQDYAVRGRKAIDDYMVDVDETKLKEIDKYLQSLKDAPTEYFESKVLKRMPISEFKHAVIPNNASERTIKILEDNNIKYSTYDPKLEGDRLKQIQKSAEDNGYLFAHPLATIGAGSVAATAINQYNEGDETFTFNNGKEDITVPMNGKTLKEAIDAYYDELQL